LDGDPGSLGLLNAGEGGPNLGVSVWVEVVPTSCPDGILPTSGFIEKLNSIKSLGLDGSFQDPDFKKIRKFSQNFDCSVNVAILQPTMQNIVQCC